jgi:hypothetical protein
MGEQYEWQITALAPDSAEDIKKKIVPAIEEGLREAGQAELLGQIDVDQKENFPHLDHQTVMILVQFGTKIAYDAFKAYALPKLRKLGEVRESSRPSKAPEQK